jgi:hypothetical protein
MNCLEYRRTIGAEPSRTGVELEEHARTCAACAEFGEQMRALDRKIASALRIPVPGAPAVAPRHAERRLRAPLAIAASLLVGITIAAFLWLSFPRASLAEAVMDHMEHEPAALLTREPVPESAVADVLGNSSAPRTRAALGRVTYARSCWFRGHFVPHFVVDEAGEAVTVLLLEHEEVDGMQRFSEQGFTGVIVPAQKGAVAVLTRNESQAEAVAVRLARSLE